MSLSHVSTPWNLAQNPTLSKCIELDFSSKHVVKCRYYISIGKKKSWVPEEETMPVSSIVNCWVAEYRTHYCFSARQGHPSSINNGCVEMWPLMKCGERYAKWCSGEIGYFFLFLFIFYKDPWEETLLFFVITLPIITCQLELQLASHGHRKGQHIEAGKAKS